mgnify:CR=1 FL=1
MAFTSAHSQPVTFTLTGGQSVTLNVLDAVWDEEVQDLLVTHTGSGGIAARLPGVLDGNGDIKAKVDAAALAWATSPGIRPGAKGTLVIAVGASTTYSIPCMICKLHAQSCNPNNTVVNYSFSFKLDGISGTLTRAT